MKRSGWTLAVVPGVVFCLSVATPATGLKTGGPAIQEQEQPTRPPGSAPTIATRPQAGQKPDQAVPVADQPDDFRAFNDASRTADPRRRIDAFQKFMLDYPDSMLVSMARSEIFDQLGTSIASASKMLQAEIDKAIQAGRGTLFAYDSTVDKLLRAGIMLDEAERLAEKGLAANNDPQKYIDDVRASRAKSATAKPGKGTQTGGMSWNTSGPRMVRWVPPRPGAAVTPPPEPTDDELRAQFRGLRGRLQNTLAQLYQKRGNTVEAEKLFRAVYANPDVSSLVKATARFELAASARKAGDDKALLPYLLEIVASGAPPATHDELRELYRKSHNGSLDGLDAALEEMYPKFFPPLDVKPFQRTRTRNARVVLAELFTGTECVPCVAMDMAVEAALKRYAREDLALLVYHQHTPGPDPMTNQSGENRAKFYAVIGVPTYYIDGKGGNTTPGGFAENAEPLLTRQLEPAIERAMEAGADATLDLKVVPNGSTFKVTATASKLGSDSQHLRLHIALAEERLRYLGGNGIRYHPMVVRAMAGDGSGFALESGKSNKVEWTVDPSKIAAANGKIIDGFLSKPFREGGDKPRFNSRMDDIDRNSLVVVAFVQDEDPARGAGETAGSGSRSMQREVPLRKVLQAAYVKVAAMKKSSD